MSILSSLWWQQWLSLSVPLYSSVSLELNMLKWWNQVIEPLFFYAIEKIGGAFGAGEENDNTQTKAAFPGLPEWLDLNIIVPTIATIIVICVGIIIVCAVCVITKRRPQMTPGLLYKVFVTYNYIIQRKRFERYFEFLMRKYRNTLDQFSKRLLFWRMEAKAG